MLKEEIKHQNDLEFNGVSKVWFNVSSKLEYAYSIGQWMHT